MHLVTDKEEKFNMELDFLWFIVAALLGCYVFIFWFLKRVNEWYYAVMVGETTSRLPPGDKGWPLFGKMLSLSKTLRSAYPNSFIYNLVSRSVGLSFYVNLRCMLCLENLGHFY